MDSNDGSGIVQSITATKSVAVSSITASGTDIEGAFSATVVTLSSHGFKDGQQITLSGGSYEVDSTAVTDDTIYTVKIQLQMLSNYTMLLLMLTNVTSFSSSFCNCNCYYDK